jgi:hypothetical protein
VNRILVAAAVIATFLLGEPAHVFAADADAKFTPEQQEAIDRAKVRVAKEKAEGAEDAKWSRMSRADFAAVKTLQCRFETYSFVSLSPVFEGSKVEVKVRSGDSMDITFDAINLVARTARLIRNAGAGDVTALGGWQTLQLVEQTPAGNVNLVSVYNRLMPNDVPGTKSLFAAYARHVGDGMLPMAEQLIGSCRVGT